MTQQRRTNYSNTRNNLSGNPRSRGGYTSRRGSYNRRSQNKTASVGRRATTQRTSTVHPTGVKRRSYSNVRTTGSPTRRASRTQNLNGRSSGTSRGKRQGAFLPQTASNLNPKWNNPSIIRERAKKKSGKRRKVALTVCSVFALLLVLFGVMGYMAYGSAKEIKTQASSLNINLKSASASIKSGEYDKALSAVENMNVNIERIDSSLKSPSIVFFSYFPYVGHDLTNAKIIVENAKTIMTSCIVPACQALSDSGSGGFIKSDKTINYSAINALLDPIINNSTEVSGAIATIRKACDFNISQISSKVDPICEKLESVENIMKVVGEYAPQVKSIIGANGNRRYLLVAQNTAEMRSTGGFPGSIGMVGITNGKIEIGNFTTLAEMLGIGWPDGVAVRDLDREVYSLGLQYGFDTGYDAHFPRSAEVWLKMYENKHGESVDGIISLSPSMVQSVLKIVGEIKLEDGTVLNGDNATKVLQHDIYWKYLSGYTTTASNDIADAMFSSAAAKSFEKLFSNLNTSTLVKLIKTLPEAIENREFLMSMNDDVEQKSVETLGCSGSLSSEISQKKVGVFCGIRSSCKLGWWLDKDFSVSKISDTTYQVTATFKSTLTQQELYEGGTYIMGTAAGSEVGNIFPWIYIFAPTNGSVSNVEVDGQSIGTEYTEEGRQLICLGKVSLRAQETFALTFNVQVPDGFGDNLEVETNPTLTKYR